MSIYIAPYRDLIDAPFVCCEPAFPPPCQPNPLSFFPNLPQVRGKGIHKGDHHKLDQWWPRCLQKILIQSSPLESESHWSFLIERARVYTLTRYTQLNALPAQLCVIKTTTKQATNASMLLLWRWKANYNSSYDRVVFACIRVCWYHT